MNKLWGVVVFAIGCGGSGVSITGTDPMADGREITEAICEWQSDCGDWDIECTTTNNVTDCTATPVPITYQACETETLQDVIDDLTCAGDLSASEKSLVEKCVNFITDSSCLTQAQIDESLAAIERGEDPPPTRDTPPECEQLEAIFDRCE